MFQHPDAQALYRSICAAPEDDAPRLILADWLDENGDETQAEYIRLACAAATNPYDDATYDNRLRVRALRVELGRRWDYHIQSVNAVTWGHHERGFCAAAKIPTARSLELRGDQIRAAAPVTHFTFTKRKPIDNLATWPGLKHVRSIDVERPQHAFSYSSWQRVMKSPFMREMHRFHLQPLPDCANILRLLVSVPACASLQTLIIEDASEEPPTFCLKHLSQADDWHALTTLRYFNSTNDASELEAFCASTVAQKLEHLTITGSCNPHHVQLLLSSKNLRSLQSLRIHLADAEALTTLLHSPQTANLRELDIGSFWLSPADLEAIANSSKLSQLRVLRLGTASTGTNNQLLRLRNAPAADDELISLLNAPNLAQLRHLSLGGSAHSERVVRGLLESPALQRLKSLGLNIHWQGMPKDLTDKLRSQWHCESSFSSFIGSPQHV